MLPHSVLLSCGHFVQIVRNSQFENIPFLRTPASSLTQVTRPIRAGVGRRPILDLLKEPTAKNENRRPVQTAKSTRPNIILRPKNSSDNRNLKIFLRTRRTRSRPRIFPLIDSVFDARTTTVPTTPHKLLRSNRAAVASRPASHDPSHRSKVSSRRSLAFPTGSSASSRGSVASWRESSDFPSGSSASSRGSSAFSRGSSDSSAGFSRRRRWR